ncbi:AAA family ATPase [bacterium]|jgi:ATP-dependent exoDNAse (exonuclease V) alpha subunit|nr:AAA family ATPase [bacterium]MBT4649020.1 AAA family ATPase [bacterium]
MKQSQALDILKMGHNVFLTGAAGSGKTYVLNQYIKLLKQNNVGVAITASTGIAATHLNGMTIHSWSGIGIRDVLSKADIKALLEKAYLKKHFATTDVLIIDEVSMLQPSLLDLVNKVCKAFKKNEKPFGGMQVILSGDLFQLPPINRNKTATKYFTESQAWGEMKAYVCHLSEQYRHNDDQLSNALDAIRSNTICDKTLNPLHKRFKAVIDKNIVATKLYTHNIDVDRINDQELLKIKNPIEVYTMSSRGKKPLVETLIKNCLAPETLSLKKGATVMFVKNNFELGYVNGTLGTIIGFNDGENHPIIETYSGKIITASPERWIIEEDDKTLAEINQIPLRLAWAITIHKSQGMTLDAAEIDLSKSFVPGMGYVALSRVRSLAGLRLLGLNDIALISDEQVIEIDKTLKVQSQKAISFVDSLNNTDKKKYQQLFIKTYAREKVYEEKISTIDKTLLLLKQKKSPKEMAEERNISTGTIIGHIEQLKARGDKLDIDYLKPKKDRFTIIAKAFGDSEDTALSPVKEILGYAYSYDELKLTRLFL